MSKIKNGGLDHYGAGYSENSKCNNIDFVHLYAQRKLTFVQKLLQAPSDVIYVLVPTCIQCHVKMLSCVRNLTCIGYW